MMKQGKKRVGAEESGDLFSRNRPLFRPFLVFSLTHSWKILECLGTGYVIVNDGNYESSSQLLPIFLQYILLAMKIGKKRCFTYFYYHLYIEKFDIIIIGSVCYTTPKFI